MNISFNPKYFLKPDKGRALLMASFVGRNLATEVNDSFTNAIHPIYAMILCFTDGREQSACIAEASKELEVPEDLIENFISSLLDNPNQVALKSKNGTSFFPPQTIISNKDLKPSRRYTPTMFEYDKVDLRMRRHLTPSTLTLMVNNICMTNCIYCYQDKTKKVDCTIPLDRIKEIIHEAYRLHVNTFDVIGGEFFLYKHWKDVLYELRSYGFNPYLSTKVPLKEEDIQFLAKLNIHDIQISLDTLIEEHLIDSINVQKGYAEKMRKSILLLDKYEIPVMVHSVLTKYNNTSEDMQSVFELLKDMKHLHSWHVVKGDDSLYPKTDYNTIEISQSDQINMVKYLMQLKEKSGMPIFYPQIPQNGNIDSADHFKVKEYKFFKRSFCSGLFSSLYILPDGKVTICEQLYWHKQFIVGDVLKNTIEEIWNSQAAKDLYYIKQEQIPSDSLCHSCEKYEACRSLRQVCYRDIIKKYGKERWYYPDANCPYVKENLQNEK